MKTIEDLYDSLFATLEGVRTGALKPDAALAVASVAQTIINAAKVECEYAKINKQRGTNFVPLLASPKPPAPEVSPPPAIAAPAPPPTPEPVQLAPNDYEAGERVFLPGGKYGTVRSTKGSRVDVEHDSGGVFPYNVKQVSRATREERVTSPVVPPGPRFVAGKSASGSRGG